MVSNGSAREAVALAHVVPGAELVVRMTNGRVLRFRSGPPEEGPSLMSPCAVRMVLLCAERSSRNALSDVAAIEVTGSLRHDVAGLYAFAVSEATQWWFATSLTPDLVGRIIESCDPDIPDDAMNARVCGDVQLGMSAVSIRANHPAFEHRSNELAHWCMAQCMVAELTEPTPIGWGSALPTPGGRHR